MHLLTRFQQFDLKMLPCVLLCLMMGSFAETVDQPPIDADDAVLKTQIDIDDSVIKGPFDFHHNPLWNYNDTRVPPPFLARSRPKITNVSKYGPPYYMTLDGSHSRGRSFRWRQMAGDSVGYSRGQRTFVYKASKSGYYKWRLQVWYTSFRRRDTAYVEIYLIDYRPIPRGSIYWLGNSYYLDASKSTDRNFAIYRYFWMQHTGDIKDYFRVAKSFVYRTTHTGYYNWKLCVFNYIGLFRCTWVVHHYLPAPPPSVRASISAQWYTMEYHHNLLPYGIPFYYRVHVMDLSGTSSSGMIVKYVWIMEKGDDPDLLRYGSEMAYVSRTGGLYVWKLLVIGADNTHHYALTGHRFPGGPLFPILPGGLRAVPKLIPGIGNITLDATSSTGNISRVHWEQTSGDHIGDTSADPQFSIPYPHSGECTYRLTVFDKDGGISEEEVSLPDGVLDNWRDLIGVEDADIVEEPDTPPEKLEGLLDEDGNPFWNYGNAPDVGNPPSDNPPE